MATFSQWLGKQEDGPQDDPVAWLSRQWKALEGNRPRVSSPSGIERHLLTLAAGDDASQDQWRGYVHQAVADATGRYKDDQARAKASSGEQQVLPGTEHAGDGTVPASAADAAINPATGKPVAVISSAQWIEYPDASKFGSCTECGWPRGLAGTPGAMGSHMTCAAGHKFTPHKPGPTDAGPAATTSSEATAAPPAGETVITLSGPLTPVVGSGGAGQPIADMTPEQLANEAADRGADPDAQVWKALDGDEQPVDLLALVNLKLTVLLVSLGLPTDPGQMSELLMAAIETGQGGLLSDQLGEAGQRLAFGEPRAIPPEPGIPAEFIARHSRSGDHRTLDEQRADLAAALPHDRLPDVAALSAAEAGRCSAHDPDGWGYRCSRPAGHTLTHSAEDGEGNVLASWPQDAAILPFSVLYGMADPDAVSDGQ